MIPFTNLESAERCLALNDFPSALDGYNGEVENSVLHSDAAQMKCEFVDSMLQRFNDERDLHFMCNLSSVCNDYLIDSVYEECSVFDGPSNNGLKRLHPKCQTESITSDNIVREISSLSNTSNLLAECTSDQSASLLDNMDVEELHDTFSSTFGRDKSVNDKQWLKRQILFGLQDLGEVYNVLGISQNELPSIEDEDAILIPGSNLCERVYTLVTDVDKKTSMVSRGSERDGHLRKHFQRASCEAIRPGLELGHSSSTVAVDAFISDKRIRKPTRRYVEEMSGNKSSFNDAKLTTPFISSREMLTHVRTARQHLCEGDSMPVYQECHVRRAYPKKVTSIQHSESESLDDVFFGCATKIRNKKIGIRRKHHRQWTLQEVVKLVDGVSQYGVGRWSEIKRQLFPTSPHRTSVDLKDKWRNLLRASVMQLHNRNKGCKFPIPKSELQRVRELSIIHPYPIVRKSKV